MKWNVVSDISKVLLNNIFTELDGSSRIKNIINYTHRLKRLSIGGLQVDDIDISKNYGRKYKEIRLCRNEALSRCFLVFSERIWRGGYQLFFWTVDHACLSSCCVS